MKQISSLALSVLLTLAFFSLPFSLTAQNKPLKILEDLSGIDTSYLYSLPFKPDGKVYIVQGYNGWFSHKGEYSLDFILRRCSPVFAARGGVVISMKSNETRGGIGNKWLGRANFIRIQHKDGSVAGYWHLSCNGVLVNVGDTVQQGQHIGYSGSTGYSTAPHLHFMVYATNAKGEFITIPTKFATHKGNVFLRHSRFYRHPEISAVISEAK